MTTPDERTISPDGRTASVGTGRTHRRWALTYFVLAVAGLAGTWYFNIQFGLSGGSVGGRGYLAAWFANDAASSAAIDLIVLTLAAIVFFWRERWVIPGRLSWALLFVPLCAVAVSFALPLFLGLRERAIAQERGKRK